MNDIQFFSILFLIMLVITIILFKIPDKLNTFLADRGEVELKKLNEELRAWKSRVSELEKLLEIERQRNSNLLNEFNIMKLELDKLKTSVSQIEGSTLLTKQKATLLVMGDSTFGESDRNALRRAGVLFHRITDGTFSSLREELQRKRQDGRQYKVVHISSHSSKEGVLFTDGLVGGDELSNVLDDVELLFLASCSNVSIADKILGVVRNIILVYEEINNEDMQGFVYNFYNHLKLSFNIEESFTHAMEISPEISEFVDLRSVSW